MNCYRNLETDTFQSEAGYHKRFAGLQSHSIFDAHLRGKQTRCKSIRNGNSDGQGNG